MQLKLQVCSSEQILTLGITYPVEPPWSHIGVTNCAWYTLGCTQRVLGSLGKPGIFFWAQVLPFFPIIL